jgi:nucleotidyltransferase/DNA polymerase involved in DNA repair
MRLPSYDDLTPSIPDISPADVFASVERLLPGSGPVAEIREATGTPGSRLFACLRSARMPGLITQVAQDFSPRIQRYGADAVVLDVSGLGRLFGPPEMMGAELVRAVCSTAPGFQFPASSSQFEPSSHLRPAASPSLTLRRSSGASAGKPGPQVGGQADAAGASVLRRAGVRVAVAPTQISALLLSMTGQAVTIASANESAALAYLPLQVLQQFMAAVHGVTILRKKSRQAASVRALEWPAWAACEQAFDVLRRWGLRTLGEFAALPAADLSARMGQAGVALQQLARGVDPRPLVPDPDVPRFVERIALEWPIDGLEPLSFVFARLLDPLSTALERADRAAAAIRLDLRLVDRSTHTRTLQLPAALRDARVLRTLLLLDLESHPPTAAIDEVTIEIDPAPGRVVQYSLLERALPSVETLATLTARLGALVGESRCGRPVLLDTHQSDAFEMRRFDRTAAGAESPQRWPDRSTVMPCIRRFRPPVAIRVRIERGRPAHVAIDRRGMPGGHVVQAAGPWRSSGAWWIHEAPWDRDEWDIELSDGSVCRLFRERRDGGWFMEGVVD